MDNALIKTLDKMAVQEKWIRKARHKGEIIKKKPTKKGNILLVIKKPMYDINVVVPKNREKEFELAQNLKVGDSISVIGEKKVNLVICDRLKRIKDAERGEQTKISQFVFTI